MTADHAARAVELADEFPDVALVHAVLALAEAVAGKVQRPRWDDDLPDESCGDRLSNYVACDLSRGHRLPHDNGRGVRWQPEALTPDHPEIVTERGQERPNGAGDVQDEPRGADGLADDERLAADWRANEGRTPTREEFLHARSVVEQLDQLREGIRRLADAIDDEAAHEHDHGPADGYPGCPACVSLDLRALLADDPTHTNPITVHGIPAEDHHAHVCPVCRRVREEKP